MTTRLVPLIAVVLTALLAPAAFAGGHGGFRYDPYAAARRAPVCTQAELSAGIDVNDCGRVIRTVADGHRSSRPTTD
jgi:hypothetical protein